MIFLQDLNLPLDSPLDYITIVHFLRNDYSCKKLLTTILGIQRIILQAGGLGIRCGALFFHVGATIEVCCERTDQGTGPASFFPILVALQEISNVNLIEKFLLHPVLIRRGFFLALVPAFEELGTGDFLLLERRLCAHWFITLK